MRCIYRLAALLLFVALTTEQACAEPTAGLPEWNDGASIYLNLARQSGAKDAAPLEAAAAATEVSKPADVAAAEEPPRIDAAVMPAVHEEPEAAPGNRRQLAPPSASMAANGEGAAVESPRAPGTRRLTRFSLPSASLYKMITGLTIVVGAFLIFAWAMRRGGRALRQGNLPADVVSVLGRVPLAARHYAELLRVGNKLVLISLTPNGAETLTEVTEPGEVDRLLGLCQQSDPHSTTKAFEQVFRQLSTEAAPSGFLGSEALPSSLASPAGAYRSYRGDSIGG